MKTKSKIILGLAAIAFSCACMSMVACNSDSEIDKLEQQGNKISVLYNPNGGEFLENKAISIIDMFNPDKYVADDEGKVHIKLTEPTDVNRPSHSGAINITRRDHFFSGWYQTRTPVTDENGNILDEQGNVLEQDEEGNYFIKDSQAEGEEGEKKSSYPAYTYSDYWDFEKDTLTYDTKSTDNLSVTLYAGWVQYYQFDFYFKDESGDWKYNSSYSYDYKTANSANSAHSDIDTIFIPQWEDAEKQQGAMVYKHVYADQSVFDFPKLANSTFSKAYFKNASGEWEQLNGSLKHSGTFDISTASAINRVQEIRVEVTEGDQYRIATAEQLAKNGNPKGYYEILCDIDFTGYTWPTVLESTMFNGKFYSTSGNTFTISNVNVTHNSSSAKYGGLFGALGDDAIVKDVNFTNVTFDIAFTGSRIRDISLGLFAGDINNSATVTNVSIDGTMKLGYINLSDGYRLNLYTNADFPAGLTRGEVKLIVYGSKLGNKYNYTINPDNVTVSETYSITVETLIGNKGNRDNESYEIVY